MFNIQRVFALIAVLGLAGCGGGGGDTSTTARSPAAPTISVQPAPATIADGGNVLFSTTASGDAPLAYQWRRNGTDLVDGAGVAGATSAALTLAAPYAFNASQISVRVSNSAGNALSSSALLTVTPVAPTITTQPANASVIFGAPATFSVAISGGTAAITYQWKRNGTAIIGAADPTYTIPATASVDDSAMFAVDISNPAGTLSSVPAILTLTPAGPGVNFNVNTIDDRLDDDTGDGVCHTSVNTCSLRAAIMQANHLTVPLTRINVPAGIYTLTRPPTATDDESSGNLNLTTPLVAAATVVISGAGAGTTVIDANQIDGVMEIETGRIATLRGLTLRNGKTPPLRSGGGIFNFGSLTLSECVIEGNRTNDAGGGIANSGTLQVIRSTIRSNTATFGGGLFLVGPTTARDSTVAGNHADSGGGIYNDRSVYVVNSTVSQNTADTDGGGIGNYGGTIGDPKAKAIAVLYNTTVTDNDADHDRDERGGIGGGFINKAGSRFIVVNSLIVRNTLVDSPIYDDCDGNVEIRGIDFFSYDADLFAGRGRCSLSGDVNNVRAFALDEFATELDTTLRNNGGPTLTLALLPDSHAIDFGLDCVDETGAVLTTDQRGAPRIAGAQCDVGAYEFDSIVP
jgi:hypothetical protein